MKVAVVGGTGTLGVPLVAALAERGDEVLALSRRPGKQLPGRVAHRQVDLADGEGLAAALDEAEVVVDAASGIEWSVLRATQFHQLLDWAFGRAARYGISPTGHAWLLPLRIPMVGGLGRALREGNLCNEAAAAGGPAFEEWLARD